MYVSARHVWEGEIQNGHQTLDLSSVHLRSNVGINLHFIPLLDIITQNNIIMILINYYYYYIYYYTLILILILYILLYNIIILFYSLIGYYHLSVFGLLHLVHISSFGKSS